MTWHEVYLYREIDNVVYKVPFNENRHTAFMLPDKDGFDISYDSVNKGLGGEVVVIDPKKALNYN